MIRPHSSFVWPALAIHSHFCTGLCSVSHKRLLQSTVTAWDYTICVPSNILEFHLHLFFITCFSGWLLTQSISSNSSLLAISHYNKMIPDSNKHTVQSNNEYNRGAGNLRKMVCEWHTKIGKMKLEFLKCWAVSDAVFGDEECFAGFQNALFWFYRRKAWRVHMFLLYTWLWAYVNIF